MEITTKNADSKKTSRSQQEESAETAGLIHLHTKRSPEGPELKAIQLEKAICKSSIEKLIHNLDDENEQKVLRLHYIDGMTWSSIANELIYSERHIHRIHASALKNINMS